MADRPGNSGRKQPLKTRLTLTLFVTGYSGRSAGIVNRSRHIRLVRECNELMSLAFVGLYGC